MLLAEEREAHCMSMQRVNYRIGIKGHLDPSWHKETVWTRHPCSSYSDDHKGEHL